MARGAPDGKIPQLAFAAQVTDLGYIPHALWGFSPIDSQGRIVFLDTFNNGLNGFRLNLIGAGIYPAVRADVASIPLAAFCPPYVVVSNAGTNNNDRSIFYREMYMGFTTRIGIEAAVFLNDTTCDYSLRIDYKPAGGSPFLAILQYTRPNWQLWTPSGFQTFGTLNTNGNQCWIQLKLVADFSTGKYVRALLGDQIIDIGSYSIASSASSLSGLLIASYLALSRGVTSTPGYYGYAMMTKDEP